MNAPGQRDPYLTLPLTGVRLIEASAGTGKTFTLATLVTRLVVEQGLRVGEVLAVTFTDAATQDLRQRIRERLERAAVVALAPPASDRGSEDAVSRDIIESHLAGGDESREAVALRLRRAALEIDLAAIFTIHGFCARVLRDYALESSQAFDASILLGNDLALREEVAADLWRSRAGDPIDAMLLARLWPRPDCLTEDLRALFSRDELLPAPLTAGPSPRAALEEAARQLCAAFAAHGDGFRAQLDAAIAGRILNGSSYRAPWIEACWRQLQAWTLDPRPDGPIHDKLELLTRDALVGKANAGCLGRTPDSPLCDALARFLRARTAWEQWLDRRAVALLHEVREQGRTRFAALKRARRVQTYDDMIDRVADALAGPQGDALAAALRRQFRFALVDEFQDTDPRQWAIFRRVFGQGAAAGPAALFLIGDPKQAIYGFRGGDVHTYLAAADAAVRAPALDRNFRSRPGVLRGIRALYDNATAGGDEPFCNEGIRFHPVVPGGGRADGELLRNGAPAPALHVRYLDDDPDDPVPMKADVARKAATRACVAAIHALLSDAREGRVTRSGEAIAPGDIAVLVRKHRDATRIREALAAAGIPAVAAGRQSLFATDEAHELLALFESLMRLADDGRLRAALATVLLGLEAADVAALDGHGTAHAQHQRDAQGWRERWQRSGPLALVSDLAAAAAERVLALFDGERRLTNYLQLAELMQEAQLRSPGLHAQVDWLRAAIASADVDDEAQLLRLESDARRVQIVTLHKSKGLEYPLVFLPFAGIPDEPKLPDRHVAVHLGQGRRAVRWKIEGDGGWQQARRDARAEALAEEARLLYVGMTRARDALWLVTGNFRNGAKTRLAPMLVDRAVLAAHPDIVVETGPLPPPPAPLPPVEEPPMPAPRRATRTLPRDWWVYSFSQLMRQEADERGLDRTRATASEAGAGDEPHGDATDDALRALDRRYGGIRFGNVLHDALEHVDFSAWNSWSEDRPAPAGEAEVLRGALLRGGYTEQELPDGQALLSTLVGRTLTVPLPEGGRLCDLPGTQRRAEMEFHFALRPTTADALLALLHRFDLLRGRGDFGARRTLEGLMTGKIDLTYTSGGRWYLLDYKSNRLAGYDRRELDAAMAHSGYDLQALIYTLALHRWLRFRLGDRYDYERDFGGARYLFSRGLAGDGAGVHAHTPPPALVHALDALFGGGSDETA